MKKKRDTFNMAKQRSTHLEANGTSSLSSSSSYSSSSSSSRTNSGNQPKPKAPRWKSQSNALRRAMQAGRNHGKGQNSGSNGATFTADNGDESNEAFVDDGLVPCPHCNRRFNQKAADRHIPKCLTIKAKPKTLKRGGGSGASNSNAARETKEAAARAAVEGTKWAHSVGSSRKNARHGSKRPSTAAASSTSTSTTVKNMPVVAGERSVADQSRAGRKAANTECPHCSRVFSAGVASRHIPKCAGIKAKPKAIKRSNEPNGGYHQHQHHASSTFTSTAVKNMAAVGERSVADQSRAGRKAANTECPHCSRVFGRGSFPSHS
jgi:uncharacterized Zn-finger protein